MGNIPETPPPSRRSEFPEQSDKLGGAKVKNVSSAAQSAGIGGPAGQVTKAPKPKGPVGDVNSAFVDRALKSMKTPTPQDHDIFVDLLLSDKLDYPEGASWGDKKEIWEEHYEGITTFTNKVQESISPEDLVKFAPSIHDNGYYKNSVQGKIENPKHPFIGGKLKGTDKELEECLTEDGFKNYQNRHENVKGFKFNLDIVKPEKREKFFALQGKDIDKLNELPNTTPILNGNAMLWKDLEADAKNYGGGKLKDERLNVMKNNQKGAMASTLALTKGTRKLSDEQMDKATAIIWRYTGHWSGRDWGSTDNGKTFVTPKGDDVTSDAKIILTPYRDLPEYEKEKDRPVWQAVLEVQNEGSE